MGEDNCGLPVSSLHVRACAYEKEHGGLAFLKACGSALNHLLAQKGIVTSEEIRNALSVEFDSLKAQEPARAKTPMDLDARCRAYIQEHGRDALLQINAVAINRILMRKKLIKGDEIKSAIAEVLDEAQSQGVFCMLPAEVIVNSDSSIKAPPVKEAAEASSSGMATEAIKPDDAETKRIKAALNRYEKIIRSHPVSFSSLRCAMLAESVRVAEEFQVKIPEHENRKDIWRVVQVTWEADHDKGQKSQLLVEASSAAEAATLAGEEDGIHETVSIENLGPVVVRKRD